MRIKDKAYIIVTFSVALLVFLTFLIFKFSYYGYIDKDYEKRLEENFRTIDNILLNETNGIKITLTDWSRWDDTYNFINDLNEEYISSNLTGELLETLDLQMMIFLNDSGQVVFSKEDKLDTYINNSLKKVILPEKRRNSRSNNYKDMGLVLVDDKAFFVGEAPITKTNDTSQISGSLVVIRQVDEDFINYVESITSIKINFINKNNINNYYPKYLKDLNNDIKITSNNSKHVEAYRFIKDWYDNENIILSIAMDKNSYINAKVYFSIFILGFLVLLIGILKIDYIILDNQIFKRLSKLINFVEKVSVTRDTSLRLIMEGNDEFSKLADETNNMLTSLDNLYRDIKEMDHRFEIIMEATNDGYLDMYIKDKEIHISSKWKEFIGYKSEDGRELFKEYIDRIYVKDIYKINNMHNDLINGKIDTCFQEYRVITNNGECIWVSERGKVAERDKTGNAIRVISTISDITRRKKYEEEILFLSYSDRLTGLRNRAFMEQQFNKLDLNKNSKYIIIMGDVNGLKLANDTFGHREGDKLICEMSAVLKECCSDEEIISRWGGDEFIILIKDKDSQYVCNLINNIKDSCKNKSQCGNKISIALGYAEKSEKYNTTEQVMSLAEKRMYRNKLLELNSSRSSTISSLIRTLHEKHSETEEHTIRIKNLSLKLGRRLGLPQDKLDELELVASLHDIGKIGIPEQILMKPSKLDEKEWEIMKTHADIGYRIAKATPQLEHVADEILYHHEKYDGTGYPDGLKGEDIPLVSRIINICDSFDVMTNKRVYKGALNEEYAINELKRCSGTQFDPNIVKEFLKLLEEEKASEKELLLK